MTKETNTDNKTDQGSVVLRDLQKSYNSGQITAIDDVNLTIGQDEFVVLVGPSGCGKTTTLRCIAGLEEPDQGEIFVSGKEITQEKPKDRDLAYVFQRVALFPHKTVRENIRFGLDMMTELSNDDKNRRIKTAAEMLGISEMLDRKPSALSGGQQQRVSIGRAMVMEPSAFLLDEPFSALDANLRDKMRTEIKQLQRDLKTAMIFVTHDQEEAMTLGDKIVVMDDGHIQQVGTPYEVYNEPNNLFVASFIGSPSTNLVNAKIKSDQNGCQLKNDVFSIPLTDERAEKIKSANVESATVGIRPEYFDLDAEETDFTADISVIEPHGSEDTVLLQSNGFELTSVVEQNTLENERESIGVSIREDQIWVFNNQGSRIL